MRLKDYEDLMRNLESLKENISKVSIDLDMIDEFYPDTGKETVYLVRRLFDFSNKMDALAQAIRCEKGDYK
jgi:hypothetical protein